MKKCGAFYVLLLSLLSSSLSADVGQDLVEVL